MVNLDYTNTKLRRAKLAFDAITEYKGVLLTIKNQSIKFKALQNLIGFLAATSSCYL